MRVRRWHVIRCSGDLVFTCCAALRRAFGAQFVLRGAAYICLAHELLLLGCPLLVYGFLMFDFIAGSLMALGGQNEGCILSEEASFKPHLRK